MDKLILEWSRCADGVEVHDYGPPPRNQGATFMGVFGPVFRPRSRRFVPVIHELDDLGEENDQALIERFANATTNEALTTFFSKYGMIGRAKEEESVSMVREDHRKMVRLLRGAAEGGTVAVKAVNAAMIDRGTYAPIPQLSWSAGDPRPRLTLRLRSLLGLMRMEALMIVANGVHLATCKNDGVLFLTGPLTGRRSHAIYCSDRCRVAAMRGRRAAEQGRTS